MKKSGNFSAPRLVCVLLILVWVAAAEPAFAQSRETVQSFRDKYSLMLDKYEVVFQRTGNAKGQKRVNEARRVSAGRNRH